MKSVRLLSLLLTFFVTSVAEAYPEFVKQGYFSCSSCHVSPGGGSTLNDYGRSFATEKLSTWGKEGEERPFHGALGDMPAALILGGNFRQIQTYTETSRSENGRWIPMQRDLDVCAQLGSSTSCATFGVTRQANESQSGKQTYGLRKIMSKYDLSENFSVRGGRFFGRYGLMIADHTRGIRRGLGFEANRETDQLELNFMSESWDLSVARDFGHAYALGGETDEERASFGKGWLASAATFLGTKTRLGSSYRYQDFRGGSSHTAGVNVSSGLGKKSFILAEIDQQQSEVDQRVPGTDPITRKVVTYVRLGTEMYKGLVPYVQHEVNFANIRDGKSRSDTFGFGLQFFPRPHFEIDAFWGHVLLRQDMSYANAGYLLLHYYL